MKQELYPSFFNFIFKVYEDLRCRFKLQLFQIICLQLLVCGEMVAQLDCTNATQILFNEKVQGNTTGGNSNVSTYNNDPWWQLTGPEVVYKLDWEGGMVLINLYDKTAALDLILLNSCDNNDFVSSGGGNSGLQNSQISIHLDPGTYFIVVDGWQQAKGSFSLQVAKQIEVIDNKNVKRIFELQGDGNLNEIIGATKKLLTTNVEYAEKAFGYVTNSTTGEGIQEAVLYIKKVYQALPKLFQNENFNTDYLKQVLICPQKTLKLYGDLVFDGNNQILAGCDILRCENNYTLSHQKNGTIMLYSSLGIDHWLEINQIITVNTISYFIKKSDQTVWQLTGNDQVKMIGTHAQLLQDNDNQLIKIDLAGNYQRWSGSTWSTFNPKYISVSPALNDEGFWNFIQAKPELESTNTLIDHKKALTFNTANQLITELIPSTGDCDRFLWRVKDVGSGNKLLINKAKGENSPLLISSNGTFSFTSGQGFQEFKINLSNQSLYGLNAYQIVGANSTKALSFNNVVVTESPVSNRKQQTWVFQFNQMVRDYFLPLPSKANLEKYYVDNPKVDIHDAAPKINTAYNKFLKGLNGVTFFGTNTSSDWVVVNYYSVINNIMNTVRIPKPSDPSVDPNIIQTLEALKGQSLIIINKNDLNSVVPKHYFMSDFNTFAVASLRGSSGYRNPKKWILVSEELTCKTGVSNRPLDNTFRKFDHGVHEFTHALQELCNWIAIVDANQACESERGRSSECFCYMTQFWFNSVNDIYYYPGIRAQSPSFANVMKKIFHETNTWMPPTDLRLNGYNPSGSRGTCRVQIADGCVYPGNQTSIPVTVKSFNKIEAFEFELQISSSNNTLRLESIVNPYFSNLEFNKIPNGNIKVQWNDPLGEEKSLPDDTKLLEIVVSSTTAFNAPGSISAVNQVLESSTTGSLDILGNTICISNAVTPRGKILNPKGNAHPNVKIDLSSNGSVVNSINSGSDGSYSFSSVPPTYRIIPFNNSDIKKGVGVADMAKIRRHNLRVTPITDQYGLVAADINKDGRINIQDIAFLNRVILNVSTEFPNNTSWRYFPKNLDINSDPMKVDWPQYIDLNASGLDYNNLDFVSVKVGDVDHTSLFQKEILSSRNVMGVSIPDTNLSPTKSIRIPVYISGPDELSAMSMVIKYDKERIKLVAIDSTEMSKFGSGNYNDMGGNVIVAWDHPEGSSFKPTKPLMWLEFENVSNSGISIIEMSEVELYDGNLDQIPATSKNGSINFGSVDTKELGKEISVNAFPNPFKERLNVEVSLSQSDKIELEIADATGRTLHRMRSVSPSEHHNLEVKDLNCNGMIFIKVRTHDKIKVFKALQLK